MSESKLFLGGAPTKPDVDRLRAKFGVPKEGELISYKSISEIIQQPKDSHRWHSVVSSWRSALYRENNVVFFAVPSKGFQVMNPNERIESSASGYKRGCKKISRSVRLAETTDRAKLSDEAKVAQDHLVKAGASIRLAIATAAKSIELPTMK